MDAECTKCKGSGIVKEKNGTVHICYDCLIAGKLDKHTEKIKDAKDYGLKL